MNLIDNSSSHFTLKKHYSLMNMDRKNLQELNFRKDIELQNFHLSNINNYNMNSNVNSDTFNNEFKKESSNAMSLDTIVNYDINENTIADANNYQQEQEEYNSFSNENLPYIDASRTLPPLTSLTTPTTTSSISISTLLNTSISPSISSSSSEVSNHSPRISNLLLSTNNKEDNKSYSNHSDNTNNQYTHIENEQNIKKSLFNNNDIFNPKAFDTERHSPKITDQFIKNSIANRDNYLNSYSSSYKFNDTNIMLQEKINKNGKY